MAQNHYIYESGKDDGQLVVCYMLLLSHKLLAGVTKIFTDGHVTIDRSRHSHRSIVRKPS